MNNSQNSLSKRKDPKGFENPWGLMFYCQLLLGVIYRTGLAQHGDLDLAGVLHCFFDLLGNVARPCG